MSNGAALEAFLAALLIDPEARQRFAAGPLAEARGAGLDEQTCQELAALDLDALALTARSFARKRAAAKPPRSLGRLRGWWQSFR